MKNVKSAKTREELKKEVEEKMSAEAHRTGESCTQIPQHKAPFLTSYSHSKE